MADTIGAQAEPQPPTPEPPPMVVGLGASAGGIAALSRFFRAVPATSRFAYVVILHLSPDYDSQLAEVLQTSTPLPVRQVRDTVRLEPGHVYVVPPKQILQIVDGGIELSPIATLEERRSPIDRFFRSLADAWGANAAAVVLSGTGSDGSSGLKRVKEHGGLTIAQDPGDAEYGDMPTHAIATGLTDCVLAAAEMPDRILSYQERLRSVPLRREGGIADDPQVLRDLMSRLRARTGHDFSNYKPATVRRRIARRMGLHDVATLQDYVRLLDQRPEEPALLMKELLISVTHFFRDPETFEAIERRIVPRLFERKQPTDQVRVWSVGCATGEEAYSLAMLLIEHASTLPDPPAIQVFATDLDERAIASAREGLYSDAEVADVSPERLQRFFEREAAGYRIRRELREVVLFARHDAIRDPPFAQVDLVSCRNLLIYLNRQAQTRLIETFHFALRPGGQLVLGTSESPDGRSDLFVPVDKAAHIYETRTGTRRPQAAAERPVPVPASSAPRLGNLRPAGRISPADLHLRLLEQFAPPSIIVADDHAVVHVSEHAGRFLQVSAGEPTRDVLKLVHPELRGDLRTALHVAAQQRAPVELRGVRFSDRDGDRSLTLVVKPVLREGTPANGYFLVLFGDDGVVPAGAETVRLPGLAEAQSPRTDEELARLKAQLRATIEQYERQVEERKTENEELQAMNEEVRSTAEQLETSREELQSVNEELMTVNQELKVNIEKLRVMNDDLQNLINSTEIGAIFLDRSLRVKLSTPRVQEVFNLLPSDAGRRLSDITTALIYPELHDDAARVLRDLQAVQREVTTRDGRWYDVHVMPYRTAEDRIDGVAITVYDITRRRSAEARVATSERRLRLLIDGAVDYAIVTMGKDGRIDSWNSGAERMFGYTADEAVGLHIRILFTPEDRKTGVPELELAEAGRTGRAENERWHIRKNGARFYASGVTMRLGAEDRFGFAKIARDLTAHRRSHEALEEARAELEARVTERTVQLEAELAQHAAARDDVRGLLRKVVTAQEEERARISRDLHDQLGQQLTALRITLEHHRDACHPTDGDAELERALALARELDTEVEFLAWELRPAALDDLGLAAVLPRFVEDWSAHYGVAAYYKAVGSVSGLLSREAEVAFYRVAQEALTNVLKHAHAARVDVVLEARDDAVVLVIEDDGVGFDEGELQRDKSGRVGLAGMRERAALIGATLQIESSPGHGTTVYLRSPLSPGTGPS